MEVKITKRRLLKEVDNEKCHNWYWLIYGQIINDEGTRFRKFKFVEWFDVFDVQEYSEYGTSAKEDVMEYLDQCIFCRVDMIRGYNDCADFYEMCNRTIEKWNRSIN